MLEREDLEDFFEEFEAARLDDNVCEITTEMLNFFVEYKKRKTEKQPIILNKAYKCSNCGMIYDTELEAIECCD